MFSLRPQHEAGHNVVRIRLISFPPPGVVKCPQVLQTEVNRVIAVADVLFATVAFVPIAKQYVM